MRRGEIWWGRVPPGGAGAKRRPLLIVSDDAFNENERYEKVMVVHLTSANRPGGPFAWEVPLPRGVAGLKRGSVVKCGEIYTLRKEHLEAPATTLTPELMARVDASLAVALSLNLAPSH